jgi:hypothetical protein
MPKRLLLYLPSSAVRRAFDATRWIRAGRRTRSIQLHTTFFSDPITHKKSWSKRVHLVLRTRTYPCGRRTRWIRFQTSFFLTTPPIEKKLVKNVSTLSCGRMYRPGPQDKVDTFPRGGQKKRYLETYPPCPAAARIHRVRRTRGTCFRPTSFSMGGVVRKKMFGNVSPLSCGPGLYVRPQYKVDTFPNIFFSDHPRKRVHLVLRTRRIRAAAGQGCINSSQLFLCWRVETCPPCPADPADTCGRRTRWTRFQITFFEGVARQKVVWKRVPLVLRPHVDVRPQDKGDTFPNVFFRRGEGV